MLYAESTTNAEWTIQRIADDIHKIMKLTEQEIELRFESDQEEFETMAMVQINMERMSHTLFFNVDMHTEDGKLNIPEVIDSIVHEFIHIHMIEVETVIGPLKRDKNRLYTAFVEKFTDQLARIIGGMIYEHKGKDRIYTEAFEEQEPITDC